MEQGRRAWQELADLGQSFTATEAALEELAARARQGRPTQQPRQQSTGRPAAGAPAEPAQAAPPASDNLEAAWAAFETRQEREALKHRQGPTT